MIRQMHLLKMTMTNREMAWILLPFYNIKILCYKEISDFWTVGYTFTGIRMEVKRIVREVFQSKSETDDGDFKKILYIRLCVKSLHLEGLNLGILERFCKNIDLSSLLILCKCYIHLYLLICDFSWCKENESSYVQDPHLTLMYLMM